MRALELTEALNRKGLEPEKVKLLVEFVPEDASDWGVLEYLRGTTWEAGVKEIDPMVFSHAMHGRLGPLLESLGRPTVHSARRVSEAEGLCSLHDCCIKAEKSFCRPGSEVGKGWRRVVGPPECYQPPIEHENPVVYETFLAVSNAWKEGRHVVVVKEGGFNLS